jgi:branched-chain amino acid transport system substrate-binding protein
VKKIFSILLVISITLCIVFSSCSQTIVNTTSSAQPASPIKIGLLISKSGFYASMSNYFISAAQMAVDSANAGGGLLGRQIELVIKDDQADPKVVAQRLDELKAEGCVSIIGAFDDSVTVPTIQWATDSKVLLVSPIMQQMEYRTTKYSKYTFFTFPPSSTEAKILAQIAYKQNVNSIYSISVDLTSYRSIYDYFWAEIRKLKPGITEAGSIWVGTFDTEFTNVVSSALAQKPDMVLTGLGGPGWVALIQQANSFNMFNKTIVAGSRLVTADTVTPFGANYPVGIQTLTYCPFSMDTPAMKSFSQAYFTKVGIYPGDIAMGSYISTLAALAAIRNANSTDTDAMIKALETTSFDTPTGEVHYRDFDHQAILPIWTVSSGYSSDYPIAVGLNAVKCGEDVYPTKEEIMELRSSK